MGVAYIALGSNLGDRADHLREARRSLDALPDTHVTASSGVYETAPVGPVEQGAFYNAVVCVDTGLNPVELLDHCLAIEAQCGRVRRERWGPRTVDLDILLYDQLQTKTDRLTLPHPHLHERLFVLQPLSDIAPDLTIPMLGLTVSQLLDWFSEEAPTRVSVPGW